MHLRHTTFLIALSAVHLATAQTLTLNQAFSQAQTTRPAVEAARSRLESARAEAKALGSYPATVLGVGRSSPGDLGATDQDLFVSQSLDVFGRTAAWRRLGNARVQIAEADYRQTLLDVQTDVLQHYVEAVAAQRLSDVSTDLVELATSLRDATVRRFEEGTVPEVQVTRSTIELERARQDAALRQAHRAAALRRLAGALGTPSATLAIDLTAEIVPLTDIDFSQRPDLRAYAAQTAVAEAEADMAARSGMPELELIGLRSSWDERPGRVGGRLQLTWELLDHGRRRAEVRAARHAADAAQSDLNDALARASSELEAINLEAEAAKSQIASYETLRTAASNLVEKSQRGYREGVGTFIDVLEAVRALREIELELAEARLQSNLIEIRRYQTTGHLMEAGS